jgi:hypothetical protein
MLKQQKTYLPVVIEWTISNLDLSHYYLLKLKITKSGWSVRIASACLIGAPTKFWRATKSY